MLHMNSTAITYFTGTFLLSAAFCLALINTLTWPLTAEIPLALSIFIHLTAVAKAFYSYIGSDVTGESTLEEIYED